MQKPCLKNADEFPDEMVLQRVLGETRASWDIFTEMLKTEYPFFAGEWRYYRDGNAWLFKVTKKKKTICWVSVYEQKFSTTFYLSDKAEPLIVASDLSADYVEQFIAGKHFGKIRGITVMINEPADLDDTRILIGIKEQL
ncbi:DUF3788 family protein [candidate division KSB1 bacterium]|nr:DUF3788 family protein [candidate division KSB1 bacterium]